MEEKELPEEAIGPLTEKFESWQWKYGRKIPFSDEAAARFTWGEAQVLVHVEEGSVQEGKIWSDALDTDFIKAVEDILTGMIWNRKAAEDRFAVLSCCTPVQEAMRKDLQDLVCDMM